MLSEEFKIKNLSETNRRIQFIKRGENEVVIHEGEGSLPIETETDVRFCLAGNLDLIVDENGDLLTDGDDINLSI